jgi:hypothetical protein
MLYLSLGFAMMKSQLIVLPRDVTESNMYNNINCRSVQIFI